MKKLISLFLTLVMCVGLCSCNSSSEQKTDWDYISSKGELVIGITLYEPMNYYDDQNKLVGFDTEFAELLCSKLGIKCKFQIIDWNSKENELNSKTIDAIWNGLTIKEERKAHMAFTTAYLRNKQCVVIKADNAEKYASLDAMAGASVAAESGSAGEDAIMADSVLSKNPFVGANAQKDVLLELKSGTVEIGVIDYIMAKASVGAGTSYDSLMICEDIQLMPEEYAIGLRKSDTKTLEKFNAAIDELIAEGKLLELAEKYDLVDEYKALF